MCDAMPYEAVQELMVRFQNPRTTLQHEEKILTPHTPSHRILSGIRFSQTDCLRPTLDETN